MKFCFSECASLSILEIMYMVLGQVEPLAVGKIKSWFNLSQCTLKVDVVRIYIRKINRGSEQ